MGCFANLINESKKDVQVTSTASTARSFVNMINKTCGSTYVYVDDMSFTNKFGHMTGSLFISGLSGLRMNFKDGKPFSWSKWKVFGFGKTPDAELLIMNPKKRNRKDITNMLSILRSDIFSTEPEWNRCIVGLPTGNVEKNLAKAFGTLVCKCGYTPEEARGYIERNDRGVDQEMMDELEAAFEKRIGEINDKPASQIAAEVQDELVDEYPEEFEDTESTDDDVLQVAGSAEEVDENPEVKMSDEELSRTLIADPLPVFEKLNTYVVMVARGISQALMITGDGGVGKSYNVNKILAAFGTKNEDYVIMKGKSTVSAMYKFLYDNYDKIVVFDDCDSILEDSDGMNILKGALDSGNIREISWNSKAADMVNTFGCETHEEVEERLEEWSANHHGKVGTPNYFQFKGACIFISNKSIEEIERKDSALLTRCTVVDINLLAKDVIMRMESVLPSVKIYNTKGTDITNEEQKREVFEYISSDTFLKDPRMRGKKISFRLLNNVCKLRAVGTPQWKELAFGC